MPGDPGSSNSQLNELMFTDIGLSDAVIGDLRIDEHRRHQRSRSTRRHPIQGERSDMRAVLYTARPVNVITEVIRAADLQPITIDGQFYRKMILGNGAFKGIGSKG